MKISFTDEEFRKLVVEGRTDDKRFAKYLKDKRFMEKLRFQIDLISAADTFEQLYRISPLHYEKLKHSLSGYTSFRVMQSRVERVICREDGEQIELVLIQLDDTHYGNKK